MIEHPTRRLALALLLAVSTACSSDTQSPTGAVPPTDPPIPPIPAAEPVSGLWFATGVSPAILRLAPERLRLTGQPDASTKVTTASSTLATINGVAFDAAGTLWIASEDDSALVAFSAASLASSGFRNASIVIRSLDGSLSQPSAIAFDRQRRLWVANHANGTLARFDAAQLASSGSPAPAVVISRVGHPATLAFDADGALWLGDNFASTIAMFSADQLEASGAPQPRIRLRNSGGSIQGPAGMAFDTDGALWVTNIINGTLVAFSREQLAVSGAPAPSVRLSGSNGSLALPTGLAFDDEGSLWVLDAGGLLEKFDRAQLAVSGAPTPSVLLAVANPGFLWSAAFWPKPAGLPLF